MFRCTKNLIRVAARWSTCLARTVGEVTSADVTQGSLMAALVFRDTATNGPRDDGIWYSSELEGSSWTGTLRTVLHGRIHMLVACYGWVTLHTWCRNTAHESSSRFWATARRMIACDFGISGLAQDYIYSKLRVLLWHVNFGCISNLKTDFK
jgi:hypothetical protein